MPNLSPVVIFKGTRLQLNFDTPLEGHRDLFGELISPTAYANTSNAKKSSKRKTPVSKRKTPVSKKKKSEDVMLFTPRVRTRRIAETVTSAQAAKNTETVTSAQAAKNTQTVTSAQAANNTQTVTSAQAANNTQTVTSVQAAKNTQTELNSVIAINKSSSTRMQAAKNTETVTSAQAAKNTQTVTRMQAAKNTETVTSVQAAKNTQTELNSVIAINKSSSSNNLVVSKDSLNVSGVQCLPSSPQPSKINMTEPGENPFTFKGVNAFVDYKMDDDRSGRGVKHYIAHLGGRVEKTFNRKVTHVVFRDGYTKTYTTAMERKIPLVSARWVQTSMNANTLMDPVDFPPINMHKYSMPQEEYKYKYKFNAKRMKMFDSIFIPGEKERDEAYIAECVEFLKKYKSTSKIDVCEEIKKKPTAVKTSKRRKSTKKEVNISEFDETTTTTVETPEIIKRPSSMTKSPMPTGIINVLGSHIVDVLNSGRPIPEEKDNVLFPVPITLLRKVLTPNEDEVRPSDVVNSELGEIEDHLKLTYANRKLLRKLLFPSTYPELQDIGIDNDLPLQ
ncbi:BRCT domain [Cinara cedri]|uniref:BRCT domain n=1 Tax=Cinara cedri TaxID=506608 RepID=A0A5E4N8K5_9HEMI|nr:BRCT domain [Cinara cedri]